MNLSALNTTTLHGAAGVPWVAANALAEGQTHMTGNTVRVQRTAASSIGSGQCSATSQHVQMAASVCSGGADLMAQAGRRLDAAALVTAQTYLSAYAALNPPAASLSAVATVSGWGLINQSANGSLTGQATIHVAPRLTLSGAGNILASSQSSALSTLQQCAEAIGLAAATPQAQAQRQAQVRAVCTIDASAEGRAQRAAMAQADLRTSSTLTLAASAQQFAAAQVLAQSSLLADGVRLSSATALCQPASDLSAAAVRQQRGQAHGSSMVSLCGMGLRMVSAYASVCSQSLSHGVVLLNVAAEDPPWRSMRRPASERQMRRPATLREMRRI